ncbi:MAG: tellurite resistance TerB family protein [Lentilitoribacter sp.]
MSLNQLFDQFLGSQQNNANAAQNNNAQGGGGIADLASNIPGGLMGGLAAGGLLGVLMGNKKARKTVGKVAGGAVGLGGAAILGAVAFNAYKNWQSGQSAPTAPTAPNAPAAPSGTAASAPAQIQHTPATSVPQAPANEANFDPIKTVAADGSPFQLALVKAMISAANADGHIDAKEQAAIFDTVNKLELEAADKAVIFDTLQNPPEIGEIATLANGLEQASEIYLVSRMAIDPDRPSEKAYLYDLAVMMNLPQDLVAHLEHQISQQQG